MKIPKTKSSAWKLIMFYSLQRPLNVLEETVNKLKYISSKIMQVECQQNGSVGKRTFPKD